MAGYYDDAPEQDTSPTAGAEEKQPESQEGDEGKTTIIPKSMFPGKECKPGDVLEFKVVRVNEDDFEVEASGYHHQGEKSEPKGGGEVEVPGSMRSMLED